MATEQKVLTHVSLSVDTATNVSVIESSLAALAGLISGGKLAVNASGVTLTCDLITLDVEAITGAGAAAKSLANVVSTLNAPAQAGEAAAATAGLLTDTQLRATAVPVSGPLTDTQLRATAVPVSGTVTASGPLTDTELRATAVPVSGPLTDTQLRATAVPVSGTVTASGPLTDTELRATAVPVSGPLTDTELRATAVPVSDDAALEALGGTVDEGAIDSVEVGSSTTAVLAADPDRYAVILTNISNERIDVAIGVSAVADSGVAIPPGGARVIEAGAAKLAFNAICASGGKDLAVQTLGKAGA